MKRIIVDYRKLTPEILSLLVEKYPDGYDDDHVITFKNARNELVEAVEVKTDDTVYLVKVSSRLETSMAILMKMIMKIPIFKSLSAKCLKLEKWMKKSSLYLILNKQMRGYQASHLFYSWLLYQSIIF